MKPLPRIRLPIMAVVFLMLLAALWAGLVRIGWALPSLSPSLAGAHGPLMVSGFLGTLIALERAVALGGRWAYAVPAVSGLGALLLIVGITEWAGPLLITLGSLGFVGVSVVIVRRQPALYTVTMALGAVSWLVGNGLWLFGQPVAHAVPWWAAFLILTVVAERLELSRVLQLGKWSRSLFVAAVGLVIAGSLVSLLSFVSGVRLLSLGFIGLALWLLRFDVARRTVRLADLTRFIAVNLLLGYGWLAIGGLLGLRNAGTTAGYTYDAWLHTLFLGFVFSMIFAHAPIILPAITGLSVPFHPLMYGPVLLMQIGLLLRVVGDLVIWQQGRLLGGMLNALAILWFFLQIGVLVARDRLVQGRTLAPASDA